MNKNVWIAGIAVILAPMMMHAAQKSELSALDIAEINREAAALAERLYSRYTAPSPQEFDLVEVGKLADKQQELAAQEEQEQAQRTGAAKTPRSPQLKGQFEKFEQAVSSLLIPLSPAALTRSISTPSSQFKSLAAKEVTAH